MSGDQRYADISYAPDIDPDLPWNVALYEGELRRWEDDFVESRGALNHAHAIELAQYWITRTGYWYEEDEA